jgi:hypothetical protein
MALRTLDLARFPSGGLLQPDATGNDAPPRHCRVGDTVSRTRGLPLGRRHELETERPLDAGSWSRRAAHAIWRADYAAGMFGPPRRQAIRIRPTAPATLSVSDGTQTTSLSENVP